MNITVGQLAEWVMKNRKGKAFNYDLELIQGEICESIANGVFSYHEVEGQIQGVVCGRVDRRRRVVHIHDILTTNKSVMKEFMARFLLIYPGYSIEGRAHGRLRVFRNPEKLKQKLQVYGRQFQPA